MQSVVRHFRVTVAHAGSCSENAPHDGTARICETDLGESLAEKGSHRSGEQRRAAHPFCLESVGIHLVALDRGRSVSSCVVDACLEQHGGPPMTIDPSRIIDPPATMSIDRAGRAWQRRWLSGI